MSVPLNQSRGHSYNLRTSCTSFQNVVNFKHLQYDFMAWCAVKAQGTSLPSPLPYIYPSALHASPILSSMI